MAPSPDSLPQNNVIVPDGVLETQKSSGSAFKGPSVSRAEPLLHGQFLNNRTSRYLWLVCIMVDPWVVT